MNVGIIAALLSAVLMVLKLTGHVAVSWWLVAAPILITGALTLVVMVVVLVVGLALTWASSR